MGIVIVLVLVVIASVLFTFMSPYWFTPLASNWGSMDLTLIITFWITGFVFVAVSLFMAYAIFRFRHKEGSKAAYEPESKKLELWLTIVTGIGIAVMLAPGLIVWANFVNVPDDAVELEAVGQQWTWFFRLPGEDGVMGTSETKLITYENPFGLSPDDPAGQDDVLVESDEIHILLDQPVKVLLRSVDVLHNFYVPNFRAKMDLVPGIVSYYWFTPTRTGTYEVVCAEYCGIGHSMMRGTVIVDNEADYQAWLAEQETFSALMAKAATAKEHDLALSDQSKTKSAVQ